MTKIFWLLVLIASASGTAASLIHPLGGWIFFAGYFIGIAGAACVARYNQENKK